MTVNPRVCLLIPVYNHGATLRAVVERALAVVPHVLVVDDGSTDGGPATLADLPVDLVTHRNNRGKGAAIMTGAAWAVSLGYTHVVTLDADGQHDPRDANTFLPVIQAEPAAIVVGARDFNTLNVPGASRFGRRFSNFWLRVQTGQVLDDVQSGFRAYPLAVLQALDLGETRYSFEVEVLVKAAWAGFLLREVPISVFYPPREARVSHFNAFMDNVRISLLNTKLTARAMMPMPQRKLCLDDQGSVSAIHPLKSLRLLLAQKETPMNLARSAAFGCLVGALPLPGLSCMIILLASGWLRLNKYAALAANQLCIPPFVQAACVLTGYFLRHGRFLTEYSVKTLGYQAGQRLFEWVLGSLVVAPTLAMAVGLLVFLLALPVRRSLEEKS
ncbi:glycosyl transferase family 2 [Solidesulfovibrio carbinoliphilus subsp. oakridgensis]|uniref:Glycosyl transferase family 2 n=1 Tax=Solidesulfovibrio carbinoliphilus subsp. oakridgensis TaxID=694327 RepID=G7QBI1_9BACT|nr:DUF2062 domain-containing protein [Solidesulfovibrio carbinoliphilus]EHJ48844.1 glycosyl transferase family 2 [Solidesulfovibrio carbinoliphilus subsp. oakridgensis]